MGIHNFLPGDMTCIVKPIGIALGASNIVDLTEGWNLHGDLDIFHLARQNVGVIWRWRTRFWLYSQLLNTLTLHVHNVLWQDFYSSLLHFTQVKLVPAIKNEITVETA